jgi:hypothetical protein
VRATAGWNRQFQGAAGVVEAVSGLMNLVMLPMRIIAA